MNQMTSSKKKKRRLDEVQMNKQSEETWSDLENQALETSTTLIPVPSLPCCPCLLLSTTTPQSTIESESESMRLLHD